MKTICPPTISNLIVCVTKVPALSLTQIICCTKLVGGLLLYSEWMVPKASIASAAAFTLSPKSSKHTIQTSTQASEILKSPKKNRPLD